MSERKVSIYELVQQKEAVLAPFISVRSTYMQSIAMYCIDLLRKLERESGVECNETVSLLIAFVVKQQKELLSQVIEAMTKISDEDPEERELIEEMLNMLRTVLTEL